MTQRIHPLAQSGAPRRTLKARAQALQAAADAAPRGAIDRVWSAGYISISLLAIVAACAIAGGEAANAELRFATVATSAPPLVRCIPHGARNFQVRPSIHQRKSA